MMRCDYACQSAEHVVSRRNFLGTLGMAGAAGLTGGFSSFIHPATAAALQKKEAQVLVVWLAGGASQLETWDPKPKTETGGPFRSIETSVPGVRISELLPKTARQMHHLALVRGVNTNENDHGKGAYMMHTGRRETPGQEFPHFGSLAAKMLSTDSDPLPGYIHITPGGGGLGGKEAAFLGAKYSTLWLGNGSAPGNTVKPEIFSPKIEVARHEMLKKMNDRFAKRRRTAETEAYTTTYEQAQQLMDRREVFDVTKESEKEQDRYGKHDFGRHCLLARRLLDAGSTFVQVSHQNYDTHNENFMFHLEQLGEFDQGFATLIEDLAARGRLKHTLVVVMSEFGRTPNINHLYGRDHWGTAWSVALAGRGITAGNVVGKTNEKGTEVVDKQVGAGHLFHTYLRAVGVDPTGGVDIDGRNYQIADPAAGPIKEVLA